MSALRRVVTCLELAHAEQMQTESGDKSPHSTSHTFRKGQMFTPIDSA